MQLVGVVMEREISRSSRWRALASLLALTIVVGLLPLATPTALRAASLTVSFAFASNAQGFVATPGNFVTMAWSSSVGSPAGSLETTFATKNASRSSHWDWTGTWESLGVPAGSAVTAIRLDTAKTRLSTCTSCTTSTLGPYTLRDNAGAELVTLWSGRAASSQESSWTTTAAQADQAVPAAQQPSNATIGLRLANTLATQNVNGAAVAAHDDEVSFALTYTPPPSADFTTPDEGTTLMQSATSINVAWTETGAVSGRGLRRQRGTFVSAGSCAGVSWANDGGNDSGTSPRTVTGLLDGYCYRWVQTLTSPTGSTHAFTSGSVLIDATAPAQPDVTASGTGVYQASANGTVYFRPAAAATLTLSSSSSDGQSGIASHTFGALSAATGWSPTGSGSVSGNPAARGYTFTASAVSTSLTINAVNGAGTSSTGRSVTITADSTAPSADFSLPDEGTTSAQSSDSISVSWNETETGSGLSSRSLQRQRGAIVVPGSCDGVSYSNDGATYTGTSPYTSSGMQFGYCYRWAQTLTDRVGNSASYTSGIVRNEAPVGEADFTTPDEGTLAMQSGTSYSVAWTETGTVTSRSLQRQRGAIVTGGSCGGVSYSNDGSATTATSPVNVTGLSAGYCYRWVQTLNTVDSFTSGALIIDTSAPVQPDVTASGSAVYQASANGTVYFRPAAAATLTLSSSSSDGQSGIASHTFGALSAATGWSPTGSGSVSGNPAARGYTFTASAVSTSLTINAVNGAGTSSTGRSVTITADSAAPTASYSSPAAGTTLQTSTTVNVAWSETETGSGLASRSLQRQRGAIVVPGTCADVSWEADGAVDSGTSPRSNSGLADGYCYQWVQTLTDNVGNAAATTSGAVLIDTSAPTVSFTTPAAGTAVQDTDTIDVAWTETETGSGVASRSLQRQRGVIVTPGSCAGVTFANDGPADTDASPRENSGLLDGYCYRWTQIVTDAVGLSSGTVTSGMVLVDLTDPATSFSSPVAGTTMQSSTSLNVTWTETDIGSGVASRSLQRQRGAVVTPGSCADVTWDDDGAPDTGASPRDNTALLDGYCYRWVQTLTDAAGNTDTTTSGSVIIDTTNPSVSWEEPVGATLQDETTVNVSWTETEAGSAITSRSLQRQRGAVVTAGSCADVAWANDGAADADTSPVSQAGLLSGHCYRWTQTLIDTAGNSSGAVTSGTVLIDSSAPAEPDLTASGTGVYQAAANTTVYFRPSAAATLTLSASSSDPQSGIASHVFEALSAATGWTPSDALVVAGNPATRNYAFAADAVSTTIDVYATNGADGAGTEHTLTITADEAAPTADFATPDEASLTVQDETSAVVDWSEADDGAGLLSRSLQRQHAAVVTPGTCADVSWIDAGTPVTDPSPVTAEGLEAGCQRWVLTLTDRVGNVESYVSGAVLIDTSGPSTPVLTGFGSGIYQSAPGAAVWFRPSAAATLTVEATGAVDDESAIAGYLFGAAPEGMSWSPEEDELIDGDPASREYTFTAAAGEIELLVSARNSAGVDGPAATLEIFADDAAPTAAFTAPVDGERGSSEYEVTWTENETESGIASRSLQRQIGTPGGGSCAGASFVNDGAPVSATSPHEETALELNKCYRWALTLTDQVGNSSTQLSAALFVITASADFTFPDEAATSYTGDTTPTVSWDEEGTITSRSLQRQRAALTGTASCAGAAWADDGAASDAESPHDEPALEPGHCYRWQLTLNETATHLSGPLIVDITAPAQPSVVADGDGVYQAAANGVVWFRPSAAAALTLAVTGLDAQSGVTGARFGALSATTGWNPTVGADVAGDPAEREYAFTSLAVSTTVAISAINGAGLAGAARTITLSADRAAPATNFSTPDEGALVRQPADHMRIAWSETEAGSGIATRSLQRQRVAATAGGSCPAAGWANDGAAYTGASGVLVSALDSGYCYRWVQTLADRVGNTSTRTSGSLLIDVTPPAQPTLTASGTGVYQAAANDAAWVAPRASGTLTIAASSSDAETGISGHHFSAPSPTGSWTPVTAATLAGASVSRDYSFGSSVAAMAVTVNAINGAGVASSRTLTVSVDATAPAVDFSSPNEGVFNAQRATSATVSWAETEAGSGVATRSLQRQAGAPVAGACASTAFANDGAASAVTSPHASTGLADDTCYRWLLTMTDRVGNTTVATSGTLLVDYELPAPAPALSASGDAYQAAANEPVYFRGGTSGSITLSVTGTAGSTAVNFDALSSATGWSPAGTTSIAGASGTRAYTFDASAGTTTLELTTTVSGEASAVRLVLLVADAWMPAASFSSPAGYARQIGTGTTVSWTEADRGAGIASRSLQRQRATSVDDANGSCSGWANDGAAYTGGATTLSVTALTSGCYRWALTLVDRVGNSATIYSGTVFVDRTAPTVSVTAPGAGGAVIAVGHHTVSWTADDDAPLTVKVQRQRALQLSGSCAGVTWANDGGLRPVHGSSLAEGGLLPGHCYRWIVTATDAGLLAATATSGAVRVSYTAPAADFTKPNEGTTIHRAAGGDVTVAWKEPTGTVSSRSVQRQRATPIAGAGCTGVSWADDGAAVVPAGRSMISNVTSAGCYRWALTLTGPAGSATFNSGSVLVDTSAPSAPVATLLSTSHGHQAGANGTIWFGSSVGGSMIVRVSAVIDNETAGVSFEAVVPSGWTAAVSSTRFVDGKHQADVALAWRRSAAGGSLIVRARNSAGSASASTVSLVADAGLPSATLGALAALHASSSLTVTWTESDAAAGVGLRLVQRQRATPALAGTCAGAAFANDGSTVFADGASLAFDDLLPGHCYRYQLTLVDRAGNRSAVRTSSAVLITD